VWAKEITSELEYLRPHGVDGRSIPVASQAGFRDDEVCKDTDALAIAPGSGLSMCKGLVSFDSCASKLLSWEFER
jgi:hypothetical protein